MLHPFGPVVHMRMEPHEEFAQGQLVEFGANIEWPLILRRSRAGKYAQRFRERGVAFGHALPGGGLIVFIAERAMLALYVKGRALVLGLERMQASITLSGRGFGESSVEGDPLVKHEALAVVVG
ncbi:MAG: hypothetical protein AAFX94_22350, partial [Myxococcota bacterium]